MRQALMTGLRRSWHAVAWIPGVRPAAVALLRSSRLGHRVGRAFAPVPPARFSEREERRTDYNSSTFGRLRPYVHPPPAHYAAIERAYRQARGTDPADIAFVSAMMGDYERPQRHEHLIADADYVLVSDCLTELAGPTRLVEADYRDLDPVRSARFVKTHPYLYAPDARVIVWIDSNIIIRGDLRPDIEAFMASGLPVGAVPHPLRSDVYEEAEEVIRRRKDAGEVVREQMARYRAAGFVPGPEALIESGLLFLRMDMPETRRFLSLWWAEIDRGSRRDQLSVDYAAQAAGIRFHPITRRPNSVRNHPALALLHHNANGPVAPHRPAMPPSRPAVGAMPAAEPVDTDIVICVHNAPEVTRRCLASVAAHRDAALHRIILVDDGSDTATATMLADFAAHEPNVELQRNAVAGGYTRAANLGLRTSTARFVVLLNSDTIVSRGFADKLARAVFSTPGAGIVGPLSNAASVQSIPDVASRAGQTAINGLPPGMDAGAMDAWCAANSRRPLPRVPLVHGFCLGLTRKAIEAIGEFDEASFPQGFGEENDYCFRAAAAGVGLVIATDTYVFHEKSQSYGARRTRIAAESAVKLAALHGDGRVRRSILGLEANPELVRLRTAARQLYGAPADEKEGVRSE